jgi:hypothetical protein
MWNRVKQGLKSPFPFYLNSDRDNLFVVLGITAFTLLFLLIFRPFGLAEEIKEPAAPFGFAGIALVVLFVHILAIPRLFPRYFDDSCWSLGGFALYNLWIIAVVGVFASLYGHYQLNDPCNDTFGQHLLAEQFRVLTIGLFPVSAMIFLIRNRMLAQTLREVETANRSLGIRRLDGQTLANPRPGNLTGPGTDGKPAANGQPDGNSQPAWNNPPGRGDQPWVIHADTQEQLELPKGALLYAEADDNYSRIHWLEGGKVQERLLRLTLKNLEEQLPGETVVRVHRSFLANLTRVDELRGNASGYRLFFSLAEAEVPVARTRSREVLELIGGIGHLA